MNQDFTKDFLNRDNYSPAPTLELFFTPYLSPLLLSSNDPYCNWCEPEYQNFSLQYQSQLKQQQACFKQQAIQNMDIGIDLMDQPQLQNLQANLNQKNEGVYQQIVQRIQFEKNEQNRQNLQKFIKFYTQEDNLSILKSEKFIKELNISVQIERLFKKINIVLIDKFLNLKKTKQEMIKFCMRKAFKHILDNQKKQSNHKQQQLIFGGKFTQNSYLNNKIKYVKKISGEKSMNSQFLKNVFNEEGFTDDFRQFLKYFPQIIAQDNEKKIKYLADFIMDNFCDIQKIKSIRRLPWTGFILKRVSQVGQELCKHSSN